MRIEIVHERDSDGGCEHQVFVDGQRADDVVVETVDPGRGYLLSDWREHSAWVWAQIDYSLGFKEAVAVARDAVEDSKYIERDED